jgi:hypothetical protein
MKPSSRSHPTPLLLSLALFTSVLAYGPAEAQQAGQSAVPPRFVVLSYMKAAPGRAEEYVRLEREIWKPFHQERVRSKGMLGWELFAVPYTADTPREYDYVTANIYDNFAATADDSGLVETFRRVHASRDPARLLAQTWAARQVVRSEVWRLRDLATGARGVAGPSKYLLLGYMRSKPGGNYVAVEQELWKPIHQERVRSGALDRWGLFELMLPGGTSYPYDYVTTNSVSDLATLVDAYPADLFRRVHPNTPMADIVSRTTGSRDLTRRELWVLVDATR